MRRAKPHSYQGLLFSDYPRNEKQVNALARRNVVTDEVKYHIADQVNQSLQPEIESRVEDMNSCVRACALRVSKEQFKWQ